MTKQEVCKEFGGKYEFARYIFLSFCALAELILLLFGLTGLACSEEHGISFTVIGDFTVNCAHYADAESPWEEDMRWNYLIRRDAENGHVCAVSLIPEQFGGSSEADNRVTVPVAAARRKNEVDILVEALFILGYVQKYDCKVTYHEGKPNYLFVSAMKGENRVFADSIRVQ